MGFSNITLGDSGCGCCAPPNLLEVAPWCGRRYPILNSDLTQYSIRLQGPNGEDLSPAFDPAFHVFLARNIAPGNWTITASRSGYHDSVKTVTMAITGAKFVDIQTRRATFTAVFPVTGTCCWTDGTTVTITGPRGGNAYYDYTDPDFVTKEPLYEYPYGGSQGTYSTATIEDLPAGISGIPGERCLLIRDIPLPSLADLPGIDVDWEVHVANPQDRGCEPWTGYWGSMFCGNSANFVASDSSGSMNVWVRGGLPNIGADYVPSCSCFPLPAGAARTLPRILHYSDDYGSADLVARLESSGLYGWSGIMTYPFDQVVRWDPYSGYSVGPGTICCRIGVGCDHPNPSDPNTVRYLVTRSFQGAGGMTPIHGYAVDCTTPPDPNASDISNGFGCMIDSGYITQATDDYPDLLIEGDLHVRSSCGTETGEPIPGTSGPFTITGS